MPRPVVHFAIYCDDPDRAIAFYTAVFGWTFEAWGPPGYWKIGSDEPFEGPGFVFGALTQRSEPRAEGAPNAWRCTVSVPDLDEAMAAVEEHGGAVRPPAATIPGVGRVVEFFDPEGNLACLMEYAEGDPRRVPS